MDSIPTVTRCARCKAKKVHSEFSLDRGRKTGIFPWCKSCQAAYATEKKFQVETDPLNGHLCPLDDVAIRGHKNRRFCSNRCKDRTKKVKAFGLTVAQFRQMVVNTNGICPVCMCANHDSWHIDHDHSTGRVVGLLCISCNIGIVAHSGHDIQRVERLLEYLRNQPVQKVGGSDLVSRQIQATSNIDRMWVNKRIAKRGALNSPEIDSAPIETEVK